MSLDKTFVRPAVQYGIRGGEVVVRYGPGVVQVLRQRHNLVKTDQLPAIRLVA